MINRKLNNLPLSQQSETQKVLKKVISANNTLANLNGVVSIISNSPHFDKLFSSSRSKR
jgi:hypothetical protein